ncbi:hypothetical protein F5X99DRAFT_414133 [Biscogniauxia marginata]|nr:hypothetical protein F5X99DRAFT_414133 [Biscogniauxia marginata]
MKLSSYAPLLVLSAHTISAAAVADNVIEDRAVADQAVEDRATVDRRLDPADPDFVRCVQTCVRSNRAIEMAKQIVFNLAAESVISGFVDWVSDLIR